MKITQQIKLLPHFPPYSTVRNLLIALERSMTIQRLTEVQKVIKQQTGTRGEPLDWRFPDDWIARRLSGEVRETAERLWEHRINPRYLQGAFLLVKQYQLIKVDDQGTVKLTDKGRRWLDGDLAVNQEMDHSQGLFEILSILSAKDRVQRKEIVPEWEQFLRQYTLYRQPSSINETLRRRLINLEERELVLRSGSFVQITELGIQYFNQIHPQHDSVLNSKRELLQQLERVNEGQKIFLQKRLLHMSPQRFEGCVRDLLDAMGYEDVEVTQVSGDQGVDVVASVQFGITTIKEVIQVKRIQGSVGRPILDQLRGALHYFGALRGTIITTGTFTTACKEKALFPGAAPIGLIDGKRLLELLIQHEVGVKKRTLEMHEVDELYFT